MSDTSLSTFYNAIIALHGEIRAEGSEFDFRYSLVDHLFTDALGWSRTEGEGHVNFEDERKDVLCYDDSEPPFPVVVCETKRPSHALDLDDVEQLETYLNGVGSAKYGILTNGHTFRLYEYDPDERAVSAITDFDIENVATVEESELAPAQRDALAELNYLKRERYVALDDAEERVREFVYRLLTAQDKRLGRAEILNTETPTTDGVLAVMDEYATDERRIEELEREAERLQAELDDVILREVYDLDDEDIAVIDEFLEVW